MRSINRRPDQKPRDDQQTGRRKLDELLGFHGVKSRSRSAAGLQNKKTTARLAAGRTSLFKHRESAVGDNRRSASGFKQSAFHLPSRRRVPRKLSSSGICSTLWTTAFDIVREADEFDERVGDDHEAAPGVPVPRLADAADVNDRLFVGDLEPVVQFVGAVEVRALPGKTPGTWVWPTEAELFEPLEDGDELRRDLCRCRRGRCIRWIGRRGLACTARMSGMRIRTGRLPRNFQRAARRTGSGSFSKQ